MIKKVADAYATVKAQIREGRRELLTQPITFRDAPFERLREQLMQLLQRTFRPEFLNRIDEVIVFRSLEKEQLRQITDLLLEDTRRRLHAQDVTLDISPQAVDWLAERGYQPKFGARPLRRTIQRELDNRLSRMLLDGSLSRQVAGVGVENGRLAIHPVEREEQPAPTGS